MRVLKLFKQNDTAYISATQPRDTKPQATVSRTFTTPQKSTQRSFHFIQIR